jgi:hypothetical protein
MPAAISVNHFDLNSSEMSASDSRTLNNEPPAQNSVTMHKGLETMPRKRTMFGCGCYKEGKGKEMK